MHSIIERLRQLPINPNAEPWEIGFVPIPVPGIPKRVPVEARPAVGVCMLPDGVAGISDIGIPFQMPADALIEVFEQCVFGRGPVPQRPLGFLPRKVYMLRPEHEASERFVAAMRSLGIKVEIKMRLKNLDEFGKYLEEQPINGRGADPFGDPEDFGSTPVPALAEVKGMEVERIRAFAEAAAEFFQARPWDRRPHGALWRILPKPKWQEFAYAMAIGDGGDTFGLAFMPSVQAMESIISQGSAIWTDDRRTYTVWSMLFDDTDAAPESDIELWRRHRLPVAGEEAFPFPVGVTPSGQSKRPSPDRLTFMEAILRAVTRADNSQLGVLNGECTIEVPSFAGPIGITLKTVVILDDECHEEDE